MSPQTKLTSEKLEWTFQDGKARAGLTRDGGVDFQKRWLLFQNLASLLQNEQHLLFCQSAFTEKVLLKKVHVGLALVGLRVELLVGRLLDGGWGHV